MSIFAEDRLRTGVATTSGEETQALAAAWAQELPAQVTLALHGDLGAGKTTFVQGLARAWQITGRVTSPTFTIYQVHHGSRTLVHLDAYRLGSAAELEELMLADFLTPPYCLAVEWPDRVAAWLPMSARHLDLDLLPDGRHTVRLRG